MPLQVDYREFYSLPAVIRADSPSVKAKQVTMRFFTSRLVDRVLRPLFPSNYHAEVFVNVMLLSADGVDQPDALAGFAASAAMACSDIPFECPISECRVARVNGSTSSIPLSNRRKRPTWTSWLAHLPKTSHDGGRRDEGSFEQDMIGAPKAAMAAISRCARCRTNCRRNSAPT